MLKVIKLTNFKLIEAGLELTKFYCSNQQDSIVKMEILISSNIKPKMEFPK